MTYNYNTDSPVLTVHTVEAENIHDAISKIRHRMIWKMAKIKDMAIEIYLGERAKLSFEDLSNKEKYIIIYPKFE